MSWWTYGSAVIVFYDCQQGNKCGMGEGTLLVSFWYSSFLNKFFFPTKFANSIEFSPHLFRFLRN